MEAIIFEGYRTVYDSPLRAEQQQSLQFLHQNINSTDNLILQCPTGVGKSLISYIFSIEEDLKKFRDDQNRAGAYILTTSKNLQTQYLKDFGKMQSRGLPSMCQCKSAQNYTCHCNKYLNCLQVKTLRKVMDTRGLQHMQACRNNCTYQARKVRLFGKHGKQGNICKQPNICGVTNYRYLMNMWRYRGNQVVKRTALVLDQAHNVQKRLMGFIQVQFTNKFIVKKLGFDPSVLQYNRGQFSQLLKGQYKQRLSAKIQRTKSQIEKQEDIQKKSQLLKYHQKYDRHLCKVNRFLEQVQIDPDNWVFQRQSNSLFFKPIHVDRYRHDSLFSIANKRLFMSATIGDIKQFAKSIGIKDYKFLSMQSPFDKSKRKIYFVPSGKMTRDKIDQTLPKLVNNINDIIKEYKNDKGIIHSFNYRITSYIMDKVKNKKRMITHGDANDRVKALQQHLQQKKPTILLSPSLFQGIDLVDDLSRFQIIAKVPYPNLGDQRIKIRCKQDYGWYVNQAVKSIVQAYGRSVRNKDDYADTFILDSSFEDLINRYNYLFPKWFLQALM